MGGLGARCSALLIMLKSVEGKVSEQLKFGLVPTNKAFWERMRQRNLSATI